MNKNYCIRVNLFRFFYVLGADSVMDITITIVGNDLFVCKSRYITGQVSIRNKYNFFSINILDNFYSISRGTADIAFSLYLRSRINIGDDLGLRVFSFHYLQIFFGNHSSHRTSCLFSGKKNRLLGRYYLRCLCHKPNSTEDNYLTGNLLCLPT